jgi:hypothetical protein
MGLLPLGFLLAVGVAKSEFSCSDFHFGFCDVELGGVIDTFHLPPSENAIEICQKACQVSRGPCRRRTCV